MINIATISDNLSIEKKLAFKGSRESKFSKRFKKIEKNLKLKNINMKDLSLQELDDMWDVNKKNEIP